MVTSSNLRMFLFWSIFELSYSMLSIRLKQFNVQCDVQRYLFVILSLFHKLFLKTEVMGELTIDFQFEGTTVHGRWTETEKYQP